ncbi:MAG: hypothetical protein KBB01_01410 [Candidatus Omnitrophica bacterium]|jgi:hypothetical protein|nr:hypothetical protein [Candidatus Omnitrophota bacterium]
MNLNYQVFEKLKVKQPVSRIDYITQKAKNKKVLDLGSYDETALFKNGTKHSLYTEISKVATSLLGVDNSTKILGPEIIINPKSRIIKGDVQEISKELFENIDFDIIIAGELIEHLPNVLDFFRKIKKLFYGKEFICTTPNAISFSNILLGFLKRESTHRDHLQIYSYKVLNTLCLKCGFVKWDIIPYHVYYTEMIFKAKGYKKIILRFIEKIVNIFEDIFPLFSGGLILHVKQI